MSQKYSIGEVAKKLGMTPRAIRFYDQKSLVKPAAIGENGYRYYDDQQIQKLELINYLRQLGFTLKQIKGLINDQSGAESLHLLFQKQLIENEAQIATLMRRQKQLRRLTAIIAAQQINSHNLIDIAQIMQKENKLTILRKKMWLLSGGIMLIEALGIIFADLLMRGGHWSAMIASIALMLVLVFGLTAALTRYYYHQVGYLCPNCGAKFVPSLRKFIFAAHTPKLRKLACPCCHHKSYCLEIAR